MTGGGPFRLLLALAWAAGLAAAQAHAPPVVDLAADAIVIDEGATGLIRLTAIRADSGGGGAFPVGGPVLLAVSDDAAQVAVAATAIAPPATAAGTWSATVTVRSAGRRAASVPVLITVIDDQAMAEGGPVSTTRRCVVTVANREDAPAPVVNLPVPLAAGSTAVLDAGHLRIEDADGDPVAFRLLIPSAHVAVRLAGVELAAGASFTQADIDAGRLSLRHDGAPAAVEAIALAYGDGVLPELGPLLVVVPVDAAAGFALALLPPPASWREGAAAVAVAPVARLDAIAGADLAGALLTASLAAGVDGDALSLADGDGLTVGEGTLAWNGAAVATWTGGTAGRPLAVRFADAPGLAAAAGTAVLRALRFRNPGDNPGEVLRQVSVLFAPVGLPALPAVGAPVLVTPVDDPPVLLTVRVAVPAGVAGEVVLAAGDPEGRPVIWSVLAQPAKAAVAVVDAEAGILRIAPAAGRHGGDAFTVGLLAPPATAAALVAVALAISGGDDARPHAAGEFPRAVAVGETAIADIPFDVTDLGADAVLDFRLAADAPAGATATALDARTVRLAWTVGADEAAGAHRRFHLVAADRDGRGAGILPVSVLVLPRPAGVR